MSALGWSPHLAVVLVGEDPASRAYVAAKARAAAAAGVRSATHAMPSHATQAELLALVDRLNRDADVDGILVQLPCPAHISRDAIFSAVDPAKDVDGFHPENAGRLVAGSPGIRPCTPSGVMRLLREAGVGLEGARALVVGTGAIVGRPLAALLSHASATVTMAHAATRDLPWEVARADVVVVAAGFPGLVRGSHLKRGAVVIDVGINRLPDGRLVGDVAFDECLGVASAITPVPGGVGPMTIACLLENTVAAGVARRRGIPASP